MIKHDSPARVNVDYRPREQPSMPLSMVEFCGSGDATGAQRPRATRSCANHVARLKLGSCRKKAREGLSRDAHSRHAFQFATWRARRKAVRGIGAQPCRKIRTPYPRSHIPPLRDRLSPAFVLLHEVLGLSSLCFISFACWICFGRGALGSIRDRHPSYPASLFSPCLPPPAPPLARPILLRRASLSTTSQS